MIWKLCIRAAGCIRMIGNGMVLGRLSQASLDLATEMHTQLMYMICPYFLHFLTSAHLLMFLFLTH